MNGLLKTGMLLAAITALFMLVGYGFGGQGGMMVALGFALVMNAASYWFSDSIALKFYKAKPLSPQTHRALYATIERLSRNAGIPTPKAYIIDSAQPNAFATGRSPAKGAIALTTGLLERLDADEIAGVIAHELAHIKNRDTLIMTVTATFAGAIGMLAHMAMFSSMRGDQRGGPLVGLLIALLAPLMAMLVQMSISRTREYAADKTGAEISGDPAALARALEKISGMAKTIPNHAAENHPGTAHMFIVNPLHEHARDGLFTTHPNPVNRIRRLSEMTGVMRAHLQASAAPATPVKRGSFDFTD